VGGFLFSVAAWVPLAVDAVSFGASSALVAAIKGRFGRPPSPPGAAADGAGTPVAGRPSLRAEIAEGLRWLLAHRLLRALAVMVAMINLLGTAHDAILVLFASSPWVAGALLGVTGLVVVTFNVVGGSLRQALTPDHLLGRVISTFRLFSYGAVPLGALLGGVVARTFGLRAPFLLAGVVVPVVALLCLPVVNRRSIAQARSRANG
jgi:hypothetical protein